ncbi:MAG: enoyl-CoA hydratase/isomerase family protein [Acidobacteria bacterium]|nr:enoyl-CoA hydratase/isomerase family protein [Acidobacteriota bacterium]
MGAFETVIFEKDDRGIARVTLNRPQALNAFSVRMRDDLYEVLSAIKIDDEIRAVIFRGAGEKAFCAGADLKEFLTAPSAIKARRIRALRDLWRLFLSVPQPLIAALHGYVLGSGIEIALYCDLRIASEDVVFGLPEVELGILPAAGGTQTLPRLLGLGRSLDMLLTGRRCKGREAFESGLVSHLVSGERLLQSAEEVALEIASLDPRVVRSAKQAVVRGMDMTLDQGLDLERRLALQCRSASK